MAKFAADFQRTLSASLSVGNLNTPGSGMRRATIDFISVGCEGAPNDVANLWQFQRTTAAGTSTAVTPQTLDMADSLAAVIVAGENHTVDPTYTAGAILMNEPLNQKATLLWYAPPGGELVIPATASAGIGVRTPTLGGAIAATCQMHFTER